MSKTKPDYAPYQITRWPGSEPGTFQYHLVHVPSDRLVTGAYRCRSPIAPLYMRKRQAELNTRAVLEPWR
jgi:hypothetical protein